MHWLTRLKEWLTRDPVVRVDDAVLGPLVLNDDYTDGCWATRPGEMSGVRFEIGGRYEPDPTLIAEARNIHQSFETFAARVHAFLEETASRPEWAWVAEEIRALRLTHICLYWSDRPDEAMLFFEGPRDEERCWRCDLIEQHPTGLGYDS